MPVAAPETQEFVALTQQKSAGNQGKFKILKTICIYNKLLRITNCCRIGSSCCTNGSKIRRRPRYSTPLTLLFL